jgi:hypothetical protein
MRFAIVAVLALVGLSSGCVFHAHTPRVSYRGPRAHVYVRHCR